MFNAMVFSVGGSQWAFHRFPKTPEIEDEVDAEAAFEELMEKRRFIKLLVAYPQGRLKDDKSVERITVMHEVLRRVDTLDEIRNPVFVWVDDFSDAEEIKAVLEKAQEGFKGKVL